MPLILTEEQTMLRDSARSFLAENAPVSQLRRLRDTNDPVGFSRELWKQMAELDLIGLMLPSEYGGSDMSALEGAVVYMELEIGRAHV